jgi:hypothetical protein
LKKKFAKSEHLDEISSESVEIPEIMKIRLFKIYKAYHQGSLVSKTKIEDSCN